jgi:exodeoxyribonuclease VII large subunit
VRALNTAWQTYRRRELDTNARHCERLAGLQRQSRIALETFLNREQARLDGAAKLLESVSFKSVLARGYALVRDGSGVPVMDAAATSAGAAVAIEFRDGKVGARITDAPPASAKPVKPAAKKPGNGGQGSLL